MASGKTYGDGRDVVAQEYDSTGVDKRSLYALLDRVGPVDGMGEAFERFNAAQNRFPGLAFSMQYHKRDPSWDRTLPFWKDFKTMWYGRIDWMDPWNNAQNQGVNGKWSISQIIERNYRNADSYDESERVPLPAPEPASTFGTYYGGRNYANAAMPSREAARRALIKTGGDHAAAARLLGKE